MDEIPNLCLSLSNRPENVLVVRQALAGVADSLALDAIETNDLKTAVTEACNNVVRHAYGGGEGPLEVDVYMQGDAIAVVVRDRGLGMQLDQQPGVRDPSGIGLPVINALARRAEFTELADGGTEVRMEFAAPNAGSLQPFAGDGRRSLTPAHDGCSATVELKLAPSSLARAVLPRVLSTLAGRAYFSTDRISDVQLVADVLAARAGDSVSGSHLHVAVTTAPRSLELCVGPLHVGRGESLVAAAADGLAPVIERLTDAKRVASADSGETLELRLLDPR
jgi:serine/threonine-protein kinase RsbW